MTSALARLTQPGTPVRRRDFLKDEACVSSAALALRRASPPHPFSRGLWGRKLPRCAGTCCTRRCDAQIRARRAKFEPDPSCVCRWDTSVVRQSEMNCASPYTRGKHMHFPTLRQDFVVLPRSGPPSDWTVRSLDADARLCRQPKVSSAAPQARGRASPRPTAKRHRNRPARMLAARASSRGPATPVAGHVPAGAWCAIRSKRKRSRYPTNTGSVRLSNPGRRSARGPSHLGWDER
jgi:hypothetical protein